jgi:arginase
MEKRVIIIGAPTSAGAHFGGQEKAPEHFRRAGLLADMLAAGLSVLDLGDLPLVRYEPDPSNPGFRSLPRVANHARQVAERVKLADRQGGRLLMLGGDCTIEVGVVSGLLHSTERLGLLYFDGHVDLNTPETSEYGVLDSMGVAHMLGIHDNELSRIGPRFPLLQGADIAFFAYEPAKINPGELPLLADLTTLKLPYPERSTPDDATAAVRYLEQHVDRYIVHFDVDVVDFIDLPVGNFPKYSGLSVEEAATCLQRMTASTKCAGIVVTELNPERDPSFTHVRRVNRAIVDSLLEGTV